MLTQHAVPFLLKLKMCLYTPSFASASPCISHFLAGSNHFGIDPLLTVCFAVNSHLERLFPSLSADLIFWWFHSQHLIFFVFPHRVGKLVLFLYICLLVTVCPDLDICLFQESQKVPKLTINLGPKKPTEHAFFAVSLSNTTETNIIENKSLWPFADQILIILIPHPH